MDVAALTFRAGTIGELPAFAEYWLAMFEEIGILNERMMDPNWRAQFLDYMERRIAGNEARFFVALDGDAIAGTAGALIQDGYPFAVHGIKRGYVFGVRVAPGFRGRGVAERLTRECVEFLHAAGCERVRLHASPAGRAIYERMGFTPTNEMEIIRRPA